MGTGFILISYLVMQQETYSRVALILDFCLYSLTAFMFALIWCMPQIGNYQRDKSKKVIILGVGVEAEHLISTLQRLEDDSLNVVGIVTILKRGFSIAGVNVIGNGRSSAIFEIIVWIFWCPGMDRQVQILWVHYEILQTVRCGIYTFAQCEFLIYTGRAC